MRKRILTAAIIEGFVGSTLIRRFDNATSIPECHREWWDLCCSDNRYVAIAAPRGFAKSTAITHSYVLASLLFRERDYVLILSGTEAQAIQFLNDIKSELLENDDLKELFGIGRFIKDSESDIIVEMQDGHKFRVQAKGAEQRLRGLKWNGKRPNLVVGDDMEEDEQVMNKDRREKFRRWFFGALVPILSEDGVIRLVGTILHMDSMLERLMPENQLQTRQKHKFLIVDPLKTYTDHHLPWKSVKYRAHNDDFSELLWPDRWTKDELLTKRLAYIDQGMPDVYAQEFLNIPIDESTAYFKKANFEAMIEADRGLKLNYYITCDLAVSEKDKADYTAFVIGGLDENGMLHIRNVIRERMDALQIVDTIFALEGLYKPEVFGIEEGAISKAIGPFLYEQMPKRGIYPNFIPLKPSTDKISRARSISARMKARGVKFDKQADWYQTLEDEMVRFPRDKHDDQVDAMAYLGLILERMVEAPTQKEMMDEIYDEEFSESGLYELGRSTTTGY